MFVYRSRRAFSSIREFSGSRGVNTWGAVWPGLPWGLQWAELGPDVVAGQSLQLQTPLTHIHIQDSLRLRTVPIEAGGSQILTGCVSFQSLEDSKTKSTEKRCLDTEGDKKAARAGFSCCYLLWLHDCKLRLSCRKRSSPISITHRRLCIRETVQHSIYYDCDALVPVYN